MVICPNCGEENPDRFRLCGFCGTPLRPEPPPQEIRKTVTIVFSDLKGSTSLGERLDSESLRAVMSRYFDVMRAVLERHGGTVEKFIGDAVMAVFGLPQLHEDDAERAVRAAAEMQAALAEVNAELEARWGVTLQNRTGVNTGEVVAGDPTAGQRLVTGDAVNVAARLEQAAGPGEVLIGTLTHDLVGPVADVEPVEPLELKGKSEPMPAFRLLGIREETAEGPQAALVGRAAELRELREELEAVAAAGTPRLVTILAAAGTGKSRLVEEFLRTLPEGARSARGRCLSYGHGITFWPIAEAVRQAAGVHDDDSVQTATAKLAGLAGGDQEAADRVAAAIGLSDAAFPVDELLWGIRRMVEDMAARSPLVLALDDLHWAEPIMLDLVEHLLAAAAPVLILATARHELLDVRDGWGSDPAAVTIELSQLSPEEATELAASLVGDGVSPEQLAKIIATADGNPLFLEQMLAMIQDADEGDLAVPPTIHALLSARLDRLDAGQRQVISTASVIGQVFPESAVEELVPDPVRDGVIGQLERLARKRLVHSHTATITVGPAYRFQHILIRDAAYAGLLKRSRAELHERFVAWADRVNGDRAGEFAEILGYHLEQAHGYLAELGPLDDHGRAVGRNAAARLRFAGHRAFARGDMPAAANLLRRAAALLPAYDADRLALLPDLGEALMDVGAFGAAEEVLREAVAAAEETGDQRLRADAGLVLLLVELYAIGPPDWSRRATRAAGAAIPVFELLGDHAGLAKAWRILGAVHANALRYGEAEAAVRMAMEHARAAGDLRQERRNASAHAVALVYGPTPVSLAVERCTQIVADAAGDRRTEGLVLAALSHLEAMRGSFGRARELYAKARATLEDLGESVLAASTSLESASVELLAGDAAAAERELRRDYDQLQRMGANYLLATTAALLAQTVAAQGRDAEAEEVLASAAQLADEDDVESGALLACVRSCLLTRRGEAGAAVDAAQLALGLLNGAEAPVIRAEALFALAEAAAAAGEERTACNAITAAAAESAAKGNVVTERRARAMLAAGYGRQRPFVDESATS